MGGLDLAERLSAYRPGGQFVFTCAVLGWCGKAR